MSFVRNGLRRAIVRQGALPMSIPTPQLLLPALYKPSRTSGSRHQSTEAIQASTAPPPVPKSVKEQAAITTPVAPPIDSSAAPTISQPTVIKTPILPSSFSGISRPKIDDSSPLALLPALIAQPPHYLTIHIHERPYLVTVGDSITLPALLYAPGPVDPDSDLPPGKKLLRPGDVLRITHATTLGSRDFTIKGAPYISQNLFLCRAIVVEITSEPMRIKEKTKRRQRKVKTVKSKHRYTVLKICELKVRSAKEAKWEVDKEERRALKKMEKMVRGKTGTKEERLRNTMRQRKEAMNNRIHAEEEKAKQAEMAQGEGEKKSKKRRTKGGVMKGVEEGFAIEKAPGIRAAMASSLTSEPISGSRSIKLEGADELTAGLTDRPIGDTTKEATSSPPFNENSAAPAAAKRSTAPPRVAEELTKGP